MPRYFRHPADRLPVVLVVSLFVADVAAYLSLASPWAVAGWMLLGLGPKAAICAWNHHHQHVPPFHHAVFNRLLELVYGLQTGVTNHAWVLHHVVGHHVTYLDQARDESAWRRADGTTMSAFAYTMTNAFWAYPRSFRAGRRYPAVRRAFVAWIVVTLAVLATLLWLKPFNALCLFVIPMLSGLIITVWHTYYHHAGLDTDDPYAAAYNITERIYNRLTGNLGYHTAHHLRPALHWSQLPAFHAQIAARIPRDRYRALAFNPPRPPGGAAPPAR